MMRRKGIPRTRIRELLDREPGDAPVVARGWVRTVRHAKDLAFVELNDGSSLRGLQIVFEGPAAGAPALRDLKTGASIEVRGRLVPSPGKGQRVELRAAEIRVFGPAPDDYPLQKKRHSFEFLRGIAHLRPRTNTFGAVFRLRDVLAAAVHDFFRSRGFLWVHTPIITTNDCEGAGELFRISTPPDAPGPDGPGDRSFFGAPAGLTVSGQLEAELLACALGDVYTFGPTFRAENSNTSRHLSEFWMVEPEMAFADLEDDMDLAEDFLRHLVRTALEKAPEEMAFFDRWIEKGLIDRLRAVSEAGFVRITYTEAVERLEQSGERFEYPAQWGLDLQSEHERHLTEKVFGRPVIVTDYPRGIKPFYMKQNDDGRTVRAMDLLVPGVGELIGGSQREDDPDRLKARIEELGMDPGPYWWYLDIRRYGSAPHAGFGLGFERALQFITGMTNIRDVIPFPRTPRHAGF